MERLGINLAKGIDETALIHYQKDEPLKLVTYSDLIKETTKVRLILKDEQLDHNASTAIGIFCEKSLAVVPLALASLEANHAFCFLTRQNIPDDLTKLGVRYFFSDNALDSSKLYTLRNTVEVFGSRIFLYKSICAKEIRIFNDHGDEMNRICFVVTTSGSTGQRKIVRVTFNSIERNIASLQQIFGLDKDVVFSSAPCTFDVFVLDLFLSLHSGSALMIIDENLRYSEEALDLMFAKATGVSFLQITPSLFQRFGIRNIRKILSPESSLRFLVLGGEQFPSTQEVSSWQDWDSEGRKRVFNIYGTTEVSCWSMIHEVTRKDLNAGEVPLGKLLSDTWIAFSPDLKSNSGLEEIILTSHKRVCYVDDSNWDQKLTEGTQFAHHTGDLVKRDSEGRVFYHGRKNDIIKQFGQKVNLNQIEIVASQIVPSVSCVFLKKRIVLFANTDDDKLMRVLKDFLKKKLKPNEVPDDIRKISFFPLSENGKVSKQQLVEIYKDFLRDDREKRIEAEESFVEAINQILNLKLGKIPSSSDEPDGKRMKTDLDFTFKALGGTSFDALRISMKLEDQTGLSNGLLPKLLGEQHTIRDIIAYLQEVKQNEQQLLTPIPRKVSSTIITDVVKRFNLDKCVDASPALIQNENEAFISVGSHSHQLVTIDARTLKLASKTIFNDRIESQVTSLNSSGIVGCYDGNLYCFDLQSGEVLWKFDSKGMIKSQAVVVRDLVIFGNYNYNNNLWCLQQSKNHSVDLKWKRLVGSRGILATPLLINESSILICTLDGICELVSIDNGEAVWAKDLKSPIFSNPQKIPNRNEIVLAEVSRSVHCLDFDGNSLWHFEADGHIFSSFMFYQPSTVDEIKIIFGCHDKKLRCLNYNFEKKSANLVWSAELNSQIYGTPRLATINSNDFAVSCTTSGHINFVKISDGVIEHTHKLPGEIFSTPAIFDRMLFVGCRDNFLYCMKF